MFVFRRVNVSDMAANRYYIKKVYSKSAEVEGVHCPRREVGSVSIQKIPSAEGIRKEKKRKLEAILAAADIRQMPKLMCVDKPTTLESIARENGPVTTSNSTNNSSTMMRHSRGVLDQRDKGEESMPQIKQCYSLLDRREDDTAFFAKKSQNKSTSVAVAMTSSVTMTTAPSEAKGLPSNAVDPGCIVYISNSAPQTPSSGATRHSRPGYLVPVYKTNTREPAYAFLPAGAQRPPHRVGDKSSLEDRAPDHKSSSCTSVASANTRSTGSQFSTTGIKETHAASAPEKGGKIAQLSQPHPPLYRDNTSQNTRVHSAGYGSSTTTVTSAHINGGLPSSNAERITSRSIYRMHMRNSTKQLLTLVPREFQERK
ncbi:hypothetical protein OS493_005559 [Desmophyllum pertusum]|uniref:Uncharacterized protein n=1 Tax=Desmophyllum pertusum TaxID=174260 RepID=A0A9W9YSK7_9CNID|nr:hypothetical protein OS493_005559 [Desmophyllum pertusum]